MKRFLPCFLFLILALPISLKAQYTVGPGADFETLADAFNIINNTGGDLGDISLTIVDNTIEFSTAVLYASGHDGSSFYSSITITPGSSGLTLSGNFNGPLIDLEQAANVTIDGRVGGTGPADLTISNISTGSSASTIRFLESAKNNAIRYCVIKGAGTGSSSGVLFFSTASTDVGNSDNILEYNDITNSAGRPVNALYSLGSEGFENTGNIVRNNNFYNFMGTTASTNGIFLSSYNNNWTISDNSFYETDSFTPSANNICNAILINNSGTFTVTGNYIGGQGPICTGTWAKTNAFDNGFNGIYLNVGSCSLQNNTIQNFDWRNSGNSAWTGIMVGAGNVNVGTVAGNVVGSTTGTGSVSFTGGTTMAAVYGINIFSSGTVDCENNLIGSITAASANATAASNIFGISRSATSGTAIITNNIVGSTSTANSINATSICSGGNQTVIGINNGGAGDITINNNTIANINNGTTRATPLQAGKINGIASTDGVNSISGNLVHDLKIANGNTTSVLNASVAGISLSNTTLKNVTGNTVYNLSNSSPTFAGYVIGLFFSGNTGANTVSKNFIYNLAVTGGSSTGNLIGIKTSTGTTTIFNNIITLGGNTPTNIYGIYESGGPSNNNNLYFNTISIWGSVPSGTNKSYALYSALTNNSRDFRNNIFSNSRTTALGSNLHYAAYFVSTGGTLVCDDNDYFVSGTGGNLGYYGGIKTTLPIVTGQDLSSLALNPVFANPAGTTPTDYRIGMDLVGVLGTGITTDFVSFVRAIPTMGAFERPINRWKGSTNTDWATPSNWTELAVPQGNNVSIFFDASPVRSCYLAADQTIININNAQPTYFLSTNTHKLTVKGSFNLTNGAQIDASSAGSTIELAGTTAQTIPSGSFLTNKIYNLIINNSNNLTFSGTINLLNTLTTTTGLLDVTTNSPTLSYGGSAPQSINAASFINGKVYNLAIANSSVVSLNSNFTVDNSLSITSGNLTITAPNLLTVTGTLSNSAGTAGLLIKSGSNGNDAKLINGSAGVNATVELSLSGGAGTNGPAFHYFVPPVATMPISGTIAGVKTDLSLTYFGGDLMNYSEVAAGSNKDNGWQYFDGYNSTTGFSSLVSSMGYNIYLTSSDKATFKGQLNGTAQTFSGLRFTNQGFNLIGNPYPCNYDLTGISALTGTGDNVDNTIYFNHDGGYAYWNVETGAGTSGYSNIMPPMQGFFVHITSDMQTVNLPVSFKTASVALPLRSKSLDLSGSGSLIQSEVKKLKLVLNNGSLTDETIVCLIDNATRGFDGDYDAQKFFGGNSLTPFIYTNLSSLKYAINTIPVPEISGSDSIPITVEVKTSGTYTISASEFENLDNFSIVLRHGTEKTTLSKNASYSFTSPAGVFTDFELLIGNNGIPNQDTTNIIPTVIPDHKKQELKAWYNNNYLYLNFPYDITSENATLTIYDLNGKALYSNKQIYITAGQTIQLPVSLPKGMYITRLEFDTRSLVSKIVVF